MLSHLLRHCGTALALALFLAAPAQAVDLHRYWDTNCSECHGHSADFARRFLTVKDGRLQGRHHVDDLRRFLGNHYLSADLLTPIHDMLLAQRQTARLFQTKCGQCHDTAAAFTRQFLVEREGALYGRQTQRPVADYLRQHGKLSPAEQTRMLAALSRVLREVGGTGIQNR